MPTTWRCSNGWASIGCSTWWRTRSTGRGERDAVEAALFAAPGSRSTGSSLTDYGGLPRGRAGGGGAGDQPMARRGPARLRSLPGRLAALGRSGGRGRGGARTASRSTMRLALRPGAQAERRPAAASARGPSAIGGRLALQRTPSSPTSDPSATPARASRARRGKPDATRRRAGAARSASSAGPRDPRRQPVDGVDRAGTERDRLELRQLAALRDGSVLGEPPGARQHARLVGADRLVVGVDGAVQPLPSVASSSESLTSRPCSSRPSSEIACADSATRSCCQP